MGRVALIGENSFEYIELLIDIWNSGNCAVLIDWRIPLQSAMQMMNEAGVHKCYIENKLLNIANPRPSKKIKYIVFEPNSNSADLLPKSIYSRFKPSYSSEEAVILYSSGTTGKSKGIILSHFAINKNADAIIDYMRLAKDDCIYIAKTISHSSTLTGELLVALKTRTNLVIAPIIVPPRCILSNIKKFNVSIICLNPILLSMFVDEIQRAEYDVSSLRTIYVSGSVLNDKIYEKAHRTVKNVDLYNVYGLTEAGPRVTAQRADCCVENSVGKPINGVKIQIADDAGNPVKQGKYGIVYVNTACKYINYVCGREKMKSLYKGWLNTGDRGYIDENGELHIVGRADDIIVFQSHKIYPDDIENIVLASLNISECVVVKIDYKDCEFIGCLYTGIRISEQEIKEKLKTKLAPYEIPRRFIWCPEMPKSLNGKVSKLEIKAAITNILEKE